MDSDNNQKTQIPGLPPFLAYVVKMPDLAKSILGHEEGTDMLIETCDKFKLNDDQSRKLVKILQIVLMQTIKPQDVVARAQSDLLVDEKTSKALSCDFLGLCVLPYEWLLGPVQPVIRNLGGDPEKYLARLRPIYPEVYSGAPLQLEPKMDPEDEKLFGESAASKSAAGNHADDSLLEKFEERLNTFSGRAEILLRLTSLATRVEDAVKQGQTDQNTGEQIIADLDSISGAINTRDLNPFEVQTLKRRLTRLNDRLREIL